MAEDTKTIPDTKPDPADIKLNIQPDTNQVPALASGYVPISAPGWGSLASIIPDTIELDLDEALGISAYVKRDDRDKLSSKDLERLVTNLTAPLEKHKFSALDFEKFQQSMDADNCSSLAANTATTSNILAHVESHLKNYDLANIFTNFPVLDFHTHPTKQSKWWDGKETINLFRQYDSISLEAVVKTTAWMRTKIRDSELRRELNWTHTFLLGNCEDDSGSQSLHALVTGEIDQIKGTGTNSLKFGGPITLMVILNKINSSSAKALEKLAKVFQTLKVNEVKGENIPFICNQLTYIIKRLEETSLPSTLISDLFNLMQTSSNSTFNSMFKHWNGLIIMGMASPTSWLEILSKARIMYTSLVDQGDWNFSAEESGAGMFRADAGGNGWTPTCFECGEKGHIKPNCPKLQNGGGQGGGGGKGTKNINPWFLRPSSRNGDTCKMVGHNKCWEKNINGVNAAWCGRCVSKTSGKAGLWTGPPRRHFTFECTQSNGDSANLCQDVNPNQPTDAAETDTGTAAASTDSRTFSEALSGHRAAAEGN